MLQALVDSPEEADSGDAAAAERASSASGPPLHRILQVWCLRQAALLLPAVILLGTMTWCCTSQIPACACAGL